MVIAATSLAGVLAGVQTWVALHPRDAGAWQLLTAVAQGTLVWSGSASTPASGDILAQVGALTQVTIEAIQRVGLI